MNFPSIESFLVRSAAVLRRGDIAMGANIAWVAKKSIYECGGESPATKAKHLYDFRQKRSRFLPMEILSEPGWDILLLLYFLGKDRKQISIAGVCANSGAPSTTALRWLKLLEHHGLIERHPDAADKRRTNVALSMIGEERLEGVLATLT